jgi:adenylate cyclase
VTLRGRSTPVEIFEPVPDATAEERALVAELLRRFDAGDRKAREELEKWGLTQVRDAALANLVYRLFQVEPGGSYDLG